MFKLVLSGFLFMGVCALILFLIFYGDSVFNKDFSEFSLIAKMIFIWCFGGIVVLWLWMLGDFFERTELKGKKLWVFFLLFGNLMGCLAYYIFIYVPSSIKLLKRNN